MNTSDSPTPVCPRCGASLLKDAPEDLCPRCLAAAAFESGSMVTGAGASLPPPPIAEIAPHFPQLEITECLGRGGMGVVYKARQKSLDRFVALKLLAPEREKDPEFSDRFAREAQALAKLSHPHIVTVHDFGQAGGFFYLLMEYVDGANLRTLLQAHKFTPEQALAIVPPLCDALQYAHDRGIVHRDIKPENLLMDRDGRVKVADFGLAKIVAGGTAVAGVWDPGDPNLRSESSPAGVSDPGYSSDEKPVGTPSYMAPEQTADPAHVDNRADIYSLGVVFYEMLTGELPGKRLEAPSRKVQIDVRLDEVVLRALEKNPELRFQQASILKTQVETIAGEMGSARVPPADGAGSPPAKSRMVRLVEAVFDTRFTAPLAIKFIHLSALGFLGCLGFMGYASLPGTRPLFALWGFFGLFGLVGFAFPIEKAHRRRQAGLRPPVPTGPADDQPSRFSRTAIVGAALLAAPVLVWAVSAGAAILIPPRISEEERIALQGTLYFAWFVNYVLVAIAAVGTTLLGWVAVSQIRRSAGKLRGLWLAVFDGLLFPMLVLDAWIWLAVGKIWRSNPPQYGTWLGGFLVEHDYLPLLLLPVLCATIDYWIIRRVWRTVNRPPNATPPSPTTQPPRRIPALLTVLIALTAVLTTSALLLSVWPKIVRLTDVERQSTSSPSASPQNPSFGPVIERVVNDDRPGATNFLIDLDSGRLVTPPSPKEADWNWMVANGIDAIGDMDENVRGLLSAGGTVVVPVTSDDWETFSVSDVRQIVVPLSSTLEGGVAMPGKDRLPATFVFKTREDGMGLLQITGFTDNPPGVKLRYKLAQTSKASKTSLLVSPAQLAEPPRLRFIAERDYASTSAFGPPWKPDGQPPTAAEVGLVREHLSNFTADLRGVPGGKEARLLRFCFSHPALDGDCQRELTVTGTDGVSIPAFPGSGDSFVSEARPFLENQCWLAIGFAADRGHVLPEFVNLRLDYTLGPWRETSTTLPVKQNSQTLVAIDAGQINQVGQTPEGKAFVSLVRDATAQPRKQLGFVAKTRSGRVLKPVQTGSFGSMKMRTEKFSFDAPISEIVEFQLRERLFNTMEFKDVATSALPPGASSGGISFGPVVERVVNDIEVRDHAALNFKSASVIGFPKAEVESQRWTVDKVRQWMADNSIGLFAKYEPSENRWALAGLDLSLVLMDDDAWESSQPGMVRQSLRSDQPGVRAVTSAGIRYFTLPRQPDLPSTFAFGTPDGTIGLLQITGFTENPPGVKIRYKLVQGVATSAPPKTEPATAVFGLQTERTLATDTANRDGVVGYRFKNNEEVPVPEALTGHFKNLSTRGFTPELKQWMRDNRVDMLFHFAEKSYDVLTLDMRNDFIGQAKEWDTVLPCQAAPALKKLEDLNTEPGPGISSGAGYRDGPTALNVFRTREGVAGFYQLRAFADMQGHGVVIRSKRIQNIPAAAAGDRAASVSFSPQIETGVRFLEVPAGLPVDLKKFDLVAIENQPGVEVLSSPRVFVTSGQECKIEMGGLAQDALAPTPAGVSALLRPTLDGTTVHYAVKLSMRARRSSGKEGERTAIQEYTHSGDAVLDQPVVFDVGTGENGKRLLAWMVFHRREKATPAVTPAAPGNPTTDAPIPPTFESVSGAATALIARFFPNAVKDSSADEFTARQAMQEFEIHSQFKSGEVAATAHKQTGPSADGFMLTVQRIKEPVVSQSFQIQSSQTDVPQFIDRPYWKSYVNSSFDPKTGQGVAVYFDFGARLNPEFKAAMLEILKLSAGAKGAPLVEPSGSRSP